MHQQLSPRIIEAKEHYSGRLLHLRFRPHPPDTTELHVLGYYALASPATDTPLAEQVPHRATTIATAAAQMTPPARFIATGDGNAVTHDHDRHTGHITSDPPPLDASADHEPTMTAKPPLGISKVNRESRPQPPSAKLCIPLR